MAMDLKRHRDEAFLANDRTLPIEVIPHPKPAGGVRLRF